MFRDQCTQTKSSAESGAVTPLTLYLWFHFPVRSGSFLFVVCSPPCAPDSQCCFCFGYDQCSVSTVERNNQFHKIYFAWGVGTLAAEVIRSWQHQQQFDSTSHPQWTYVLKCSVNPMFMSYNTIATPAAPASVYVLNCFVCGCKTSLSNCGELGGFFFRMRFAVSLLSAQHIICHQVAHLS